MHLTADQAYGWITDIRSNLNTFKRAKHLSNQQKLEFISTQYDILYQLSRAIEGKVRFIGCPAPFRRNNG